MAANTFGIGIAFRSRRVAQVACLQATWVAEPEEVEVIRPIDWGRKKWAQEALAYNSLVVAWPELTKLAMAERTHRHEPQKEQKEMF